DYGLYTSAGYFADRVFSDPEGRVEGTAGNGNYALGTPNPPANSKSNDDTVDGVPTHAGEVITSSGPDNIVADPNTTNTIDPGSVNQSLPGFITFNFPTSIGKLQGNNTNQWSSIVFLTSNVAPTYWAGRVTDGVGDYSDGDVPVASSEPGTLLMIVIGVAGLSGSYGWRRWRTGPV